jgi:hypothetical protein
MLDCGKTGVHLSRLRAPRPQAGPALARPLTACPGLRLLVTRRERLHLHAEREVPVAPLRLPAAAERGDPDRLGEIASVAMLLQRVRGSSRTSP